MRGKLDALIRLAAEENPGVEGLELAKGGHPPNLIEEPKLAWAGPTARASLEKIIRTRSTLVSIHYLEVGLERSRSVVRIRRKDGSVGSGFLAHGNYLITNNHVLPTPNSLEGTTIYFNYQETLDGLHAHYELAELSGKDFHKTSVDDDWTAVRVEAAQVQKWGCLKMVKKAAIVGEHVNIIQHPAGGPKQVSFSAGAIAFVGGGKVQYLTDTLPGSSGSPVFNEKWDLVAVHHAGGWLAEPNAQVKTTYYRNEGIAIERVICGLEQS
jgi:V8-like Glu-specific endopeptidase